MNYYDSKNLLQIINRVLKKEHKMFVLFMAALIMIPFAIVALSDWRLVVAFWIFMFLFMLVWKLIVIL